MSLRKRIADWWRGEYVTSSPSAEYIFLNHYRWHWTALVARALVAWHSDNWYKFWPILIASLTLLLAYLRFKPGP